MAAVTICDEVAFATALLPFPARRFGVLGATLLVCELRLRTKSLCVARAQSL